jgi:hypothetical protein
MEGAILELPDSREFRRLAGMGSFMKGTFPCFLVRVFQLCEKKRLKSSETLRDLSQICGSWSVVKRDES